MAKLTKAEYSNDVNYYELELSDEQLKLYKEDEDSFWEHFDEM